MTKKDNTALFAAILLTISMATATGRGQSEELRQSSSSQSPDGQNLGKVLVTTRLDIDFSKHMITFIELGADRCIPCKAMQPIMKEIAETYPDRVQVVFYDVWKDPEPAHHYRIQLIPTQIFLDQKGQEISRHVGFFSKEEILELLKKHGVR